MAIEKVIVIDDEPLIRRSLELQLRNKRLTVVLCSTMAEAERLISKDSFDLMFVDVRLPDGDGSQLLYRMNSEPEKPLIVIMTGYGTIDSAMGYIREGAFDYIIKPFTASQIDVILKKAENFNQAVKVSQILAHEKADSTPLIGSSAPIQELRQLIQKVAPTEATVLISGENGTGKELVASEIFLASARSRMPFIKVNCAAISETLIESEFFGHERGAFTGATEKREGRFELANGGTILLDEISEISLKLQAKLLRALQEREFERVGGNRTIKVNVRVLATTNRDLQKCVEKQEFRQDLYYRLNVFPIVVPALKKRKEDIPQLTRAFLSRLARRNGTSPPFLGQAALRILDAYDWPGNVRELQNVMERAVILSEPGQEITPHVLEAMFPAELLGNWWNGRIESTRSSIGLTFPDHIVPLEQMEREYILHALKKSNGNRTNTAQLLGISIRTLRNKLNELKAENDPELNLQKIRKDADQKVLPPPPLT
ncbi:MAG: sigma-54-dependent Fis family transcriptional regulator [Verrucomicrobia bacterium]|nr:sigma-54-dependent Fis family transcriptional regulator [Verrucomicrobiota bacterium]